ncbi:sensor histidine kinase [Pseudoalteromonas sp. SSDWG2]|uniref:sensor histidine kinase n=1 Tax=Pseudoalteromonas sp. SSDWG2 TaxID=3139391 RepID=UPI003BAC208D
MRKQFFRLFAFIVVSVIAALIAFGQLYQNYVIEKSPTIALPISQWPALIENKESTMVALNRRDLLLPASLEQQLNQYKMLTVAQDEGNFVYLLPNNDQLDTVYRVGPITVAPPQEDHSIYFLLVYSAIALLLMSLIWPVFKDLASLKIAARRFAKDKQAFATTVKPSSTVYPLAQSLSDMSTQISKFIQLHEDLSRIISHEIRTPLSRMRFMLSLQTSIDPELDATMHRNIDEIENRLRQYLDFARVEYLTQPLQRDDLDAVRFISQEANKNQLFTDVQIITEVNAPRIYCEQNSFAILVQNLLFNGVKYAQNKVVLSFTHSDNMQTLEVYDDGPGLPNDADSLLAPFSSSKGSAVASGYGLGLYIVDRICLWHGGSLTLNNHPQTGGAHITITWPTHTD